MENQLPEILILIVLVMIFFRLGSLRNQQVVAPPPPPSENEDHLKSIVDYVSSIHEEILDLKSRLKEHFPTQYEIRKKMDPY